MEEEIRKRCAVVICVYNNGGTVRKIVERSLAQNCALTVVVDDGCTDCSMEKLLSGLEITLLHHSTNLGKGKALETAVRYLAALPPEKQVDYMISLDADGQHDPSDIEQFLPLLAGGKEFFVTGCRSFRENVPFRSKLGRKLSNFFVWLETGIKIMDTQSGFRAYPLAVIRCLDCRRAKYDWETEVIVKALQNGALFREVGIKVNYPPEKERISHFHIWKDNYRIAHLHLQLLLERKMPFFRKRTGKSGK